MNQGTYRGTSGTSPHLLISAFRADVDVLVVRGRYARHEQVVLVPVALGTEGAQQTCRCYRCGTLLTVETVLTDALMRRPVCVLCQLGDLSQVPPPAGLSSEGP